MRCKVSACLYVCRQTAVASSLTAFVIVFVCMIIHMHSIHRCLYSSSVSCFSHSDIQQHSSAVGSAGGSRKDNCSGRGPVISICPPIKLFSTAAVNIPCTCAYPAVILSAVCGDLVSCFFLGCTFHQLCRSSHFYSYLEYPALPPPPLSLCVCINRVFVGGEWLTIPSAPAKYDKFLRARASIFREISNMLQLTEHPNILRLHEVRTYIGRKPLFGGTVLARRLLVLLASCVKCVFLFLTQAAQQSSGCRTFFVSLREIIFFMVVFLEAFFCMCDVPS